MGDHRGKEWQREAHEAVRTHLQQNACQNDGAGSRRFYVGIGQPGVEGEHGDFDGESNEKSYEEPDGDVERNERRRLIKLGNTEGENASKCVVMEVEKQDAK